MREYIEWFNHVLTAAIQLYFRQGCELHSIEEVRPPENGWMERVTRQPEIRFDERVAVMLALMPHVCPQALDALFVRNRKFDRPYTEFGGWSGVSHGGFLPTGETVSFILAGDDMERRKEVIRMFGREHWFCRKNILRLEGAGEGEPLLSGRLCVSDELLCRMLFDTEYRPDYSTGFPARRITTELAWKDLVLDNKVLAELEEINTWISSHHTVMEEWGLSRYLKAGYRALFYGAPGTGKRLAATLLGKRNGVEVYRVIVPECSSEEEKNLACVFDLAERHNWILLLDETDALFGASNERCANRDVARLLRRIEDFPGTIILVTDHKLTIDEAFLSRFQTVVHFPMPDEELRRRLWRNMLPAKWLGQQADELITLAAKTELSGGSIANVVRRCALCMIASGDKTLDKQTLKEALLKEKAKI